jgi:hypothetical protein
VTDETLEGRGDSVGCDFAPRARRDVVTVEIDGDGIVYEETRNVSHLLNPTGLLVWQLLDGTTRLDELSAELAEAFGVGFKGVLADVVTIVEELLRRGLLDDFPGETTETGTSVTG